MQISNKNALQAAWNFFSGNYALSFGTIGILTLLYLFGMIPVIGLIFILAYQIFTLSFQIYFARVVDEADFLEMVKQKASHTRISEFLTTYLDVATGGFLALILIGLGFLLLFLASIAIFSDFNMEQMSNGMEATGDITAIIISSIPSLIILTIATFLFYFFPAVMGNIIKSENFNTAFKSAFLLFSPSFWKGYFNKEYFLLILGWSFILLAAGIVIILFSSLIITLPFALVLTYILSLYNAAIYIFSAKLFKGL